MDAGWSINISKTMISCLFSFGQDTVGCIFSFLYSFVVVVFFMNTHWIILFVPMCMQGYICLFLICVCVCAFSFSAARDYVICLKHAWL